MYIAELHGKLSSRLEGAEDILTSNVFSFFRYCNRSVFLRRYLAMLGFEVSALDVMHCEFIFWPRFDENTEPDLVIRVGGHYILFEAKYRSGFGDESSAAKAQLVREIEGGIEEANDNGECFSLVAITADYCYKPEKFLCLSPEHRKSFRWTSWQKTAVLIQCILESDEPLTSPEREFAEDLYSLLCKKNLREYRGTSSFDSFKYEPKSFDPIFFDAATAAFRGDFIGFVTSLSCEAALATLPDSIFLNAQVAVGHTANTDRPLRHRSEREFFTPISTQDHLTPSEPVIFFGSNLDGEQRADSPPV